MWLFRRKSEPRLLRNGSGATIEVASPTNDHETVEWWADLSVLVGGLSDGDRSTIIGLKRIVEQGHEGALTTVEGSVTHELWNRLAYFGYLSKTDPEIQGAPPEVVSSVARFRLTDFGKERLPWFMGATQAQFNALKGDLKPLRAFCKAFKSMDRFHKSLGTEGLEQLRELFFNPPKGIASQSGSRQDRLFDNYVKVGAMSKPDRRSFAVTDIAELTVPFMFDKFIAETRPNRPS